MRIIFDAYATVFDTIIILVNSYIIACCSESICNISSSGSSVIPMDSSTEVAARKQREDCFEVRRRRKGTYHEREQKHGLIGTESQAAREERLERE